MVLTRAQPSQIRETDSTDASSRDGRRGYQPNAPVDLSAVGPFRPVRRWRWPLLWRPSSFAVRKGGNLRADVESPASQGRPAPQPQLLWSNRKSSTAARADQPDNPA